MGKSRKYDKLLKTMTYSLNETKRNSETMKTLKEKVKNAEKHMKEKNHE